MRKHTELSYLVKPNRLIMKPIYAAMVLVHTFPKEYLEMSSLTAFDWNKNADLRKIWSKVKTQIR